MQGSFFKFFMERNNYGDIFLKIMHKDVTSSLVIYNKTNSAECLNDFPS